MTLPSVLVVTSELVGPFKNGGIGTATTGLIETVSGMGCPTTVLYTGAIWHVEIDMAPWVEAYRGIGVELVALTLEEMQGLAGPVRDQGLGAAWLVLDFLTRRRFDIVHFNDTLGEGLYALAAKHLGIGFEHATLVLGLHSPTRWVMQLNRQLVNNVVYAAFDWAERISVQSADLLWGPSEYLIDWIRRDGWVLPAQVECRQYVMPSPWLFEPDEARFAAADALPAPRRIARPAEFVFFGRLEERKGLRGFCAALDAVAERLEAAGTAVTFLGKPVPQGDESSADWLRRRGAAWRFTWRLETGFGQREALAYLRGRDCVAIMASTYDNSPCTVYEAIQNGLPFLASATGGIPELIHPDDHARALFDDSADGLARALARALDEGAATVRPRIDPAENRRRWRGLHQPGAAAATMPAAQEADPRFVVLIDHRGDDDGLIETVQSVRWALGARAVRIVVLAETAPAAGAPDGTLLVEAGRERRLDRALERVFTETAADWLLCLAGGARLDERLVPALRRALAAPDLGAGLVPAGVLPDGRVVPPFGSRVFGFFEGFAFTGGAVLAMEQVLAALTTHGTLNGTPFAGLADLVAAAGGGLWPLPVPLIALPSRALPAPVSPDGARIAAFDAADPVERGLIAAIGLAGYRRAWLNRKRRLLLTALRLPGATWLGRTLRAARRLRRR